MVSSGLVRRVGSVGQEPAGGRAPVDRAGRPAPLLSPGDPALPAPQWCRLAPWTWSLLHRVAPSLLSVGSVRRWSGSKWRLTGLLIGPMFAGS